MFFSAFFGLVITLKSHEISWLQESNTIENFVLPWTVNMAILGPPHVWKRKGINVAVMVANGEMDCDYQQRAAAYMVIQPARMELVVDPSVRYGLYRFQT